MAHLVGYDSSDGEENDGRANRVPSPKQDNGQRSINGWYNSIGYLTSHSFRATDATDVDSQFRQQTHLNRPLTPEKISRDLVGPLLTYSSDLGDARSSSGPNSPFSAQRASIRDLTLPVAPNLDIPPSPPGSPLLESEKKFEHFLELKKQGVHFNEKLASSPALKNPRLLQKLMQSAGLAENDQYATTLPKTIWDPSSFPAWAFKEELAKTQQATQQKRSDLSTKTQRSNLEFVSARNNETSKKPTSAVDGPKSGLSAAERVMAGLSRKEA
ncbi:MAG: hypothetical protein Q9190_006429 [Brigantiaea leucoxantha]